MIDLEAWTVSSQSSYELDISSIYCASVTFLFCPQWSTSEGDTSPCTLELRRNRQAVDTAKFCRSQAHAAKVRSSVLNGSTVSKSKQKKTCWTRNSRSALGSCNCQLPQKRTWEMNIFLNRWHLWCQILQPKHAKPMRPRLQGETPKYTGRPKKKRSSHLSQEFEGNARNQMKSVSFVIRLGLDSKFPTAVWVAYLETCKQKQSKLK